MLAMAEIQNRAERKLPPPRAAFREIVQHEPYPVESKARDILQKLKEGGITRFLLLFRGSRSRSEVVATFWRCWSCARRVYCIWQALRQTVSSGRSAMTCLRI